MTGLCLAGSPAARKSKNCHLPVRRGSKKDGEGQGWRGQSGCSKRESGEGGCCSCEGQGSRSVRISSMEMCFVRLQVSFTGCILEWFAIWFVQCMIWQCAWMKDGEAGSMSRVRQGCASLQVRPTMLEACWDGLIFCLCWLVCWPCVRDKPVSNQKIFFPERDCRWSETL